MTMTTMRGGGEGREKEREKEGEREKAACRKLHSPKPLTKKMRGADYCKFLRRVELKV